MDSRSIISCTVGIISFTFHPSKWSATQLLNRPYNVLGLNCTSTSDTHEINNKQIIAWIHMRGAWIEEPIHHGSSPTRSESRKGPGVSHDQGFKKTLDARWTLAYGLEFFVISHDSPLRNSPCPTEKNQNHAEKFESNIILNSFYGHCTCFFRPTTPQIWHC